MAIPFESAVTIARQLLKYQGFGTGDLISTSGELGVFDLLRNKRHPTLFDVGSHLGEYVDAFFTRFGDGRAFVFEPSVDHFRILCTRLKHQPNVQFFQLALGAEQGDAVLYKDEDITGLASLTRRRLNHFGINMNKEERVKVSTLDEIRKDAVVKFIDLLKIDVEGHELSVLRGGVRAFDDCAIGLVQFEFGGSNLDTKTSLQDFFYFFSHYRFEIGIVKPSGKIHMLRHYDEMYEQYRTTNYVAVPIRDR